MLQRNCWLRNVFVFGLLIVCARQARATDYYVAPSGGSDLNNGSLGTPFATITKGISSAAAGDTIFLRGGSFNISSTISIGTSKSGTSANPFNLVAYPGESPILDFRGEPYNANNSGMVGINLSANYWNIKGLTIQYAADNGIKISGSNNKIEQVVTRQNQDSGLIISGSATVHPSNNLILNCDSYGNFDFGAAGENADGFAAKFRGIGTGNVFSGVRSYDNADDGFDFWQAEHGVTVVNSWAFHNGKGAVFNNPAGYQGDGNGLKLGHDSSTHVLENLLVWGNAVNGVDINGNATQLEANSNPVSISHGVTVYNVTAVGNGGKNFNFDENPTTATPATTHILKNNVSFSGGGTTILAGNVADHNSFNGPAGSPVGLGATAADFVSTSDVLSAVFTDANFHPAGTGGDRSGTTTPVYATGPAVGARQADGSLPLIDFMRLVAGSHLIDAGVNVGLPFNGSAPDLGWLETSVPGPQLPGDYNGDNIVDAADFTVWRDNLGSAVSLPNDATPGTVDATDYDVWVSHFGGTFPGSGAGSTGTPVPEPAGAVLLILAVGAILSRRVVLIK